MESNKPVMGFRLLMLLYVCSCILQINIFELSWVEPDSMVLERQLMQWYWPVTILRLKYGIHRSPVDSPHKGQWLGNLIFSLMCAWQLSKLSICRWLETPWRSMWRHVRATHNMIQDSSLSITILRGTFTKITHLTGFMSGIQVPKEKTNLHKGTFLARE